ncbi:MAG: ATPase [Chlamydiia bacterium]|nr:ATPase [Chlamydiia bacterium]
MGKSLKKRALEFVGRDKELRLLESLQAKKSSSLVVVKGRRRIGKSRLIDEFAEGKKTYKFVGLPPINETTKEKELDEFARQLSALTGMPEVKVDDWSKLFALLSEKVSKGKVVVVFDEISWMGSQDDLFLGKLKTAWDELFSKNPQLIMILCGSVSMWIDDHILNSRAFYGRISWTIDLQPLPLNDCNKLLIAQGFRGSDYEKFKILSVTGGIPWYLEQMQGKLSADENIQRQCFTKGGILVEEFGRIFYEIFGKRDHVYKSLVEAIASGPADYETISKRSGYQSSGRLSEYLDNLTKGGFIARDYTWSIKSGKESRLSLYRLKDNYLRFFLKYIEPRLNQIDKGRLSALSLSQLSGWEAILGLQFENLVLANRKLVLDRLHIRPESVLADNPYFQRGTKNGKGCQVDYLIQTKYHNLYAIEIKFSQGEIDGRVIEEMEEKLSRINKSSKDVILPVLIHVNGVKASVREREYFHEIIDFGDFLLT